MPEAPEEVHKALPEVRKLLDEVGKVLAKQGSGPEVSSAMTVNLNLALACLFTIHPERATIAASATMNLPRRRQQGLEWRR
jgi:hypothetical protein